MKVFTKKLIAAGMAGILLASAFTACSSKKTPDPEPLTQASQAEEPEAGLSGGWEISSYTVTPELKAYFDEAVGQLDGYFYEPVQLLASQVVAGMNYAFLTRSTVVAYNSTPEYVITYIYVDTEGKATYLGDTRIDLPGAAGEQLPGGWSYAEDPLITDDVIDIMQKATETFAGATEEPVAYIGSQVVAGMNHAILCKETATVPDAAPTFSLVYVYEDLDGNCEVTDIVPIELEAA